MINGNLLEIFYDRTIGSQTKTLTPSSCEQYGYSHATKTIEDEEWDVYYLIGDSSDNYIRDEEGYPINYIIQLLKERWNHIAPSCSSYKISYADVDKEGSGRNSLTGEMFRERIGNYCKLDLTWDLIPNTVEYNNWYKILTNLPPNFYCKLLMPSGEIVTKTFYRGDISTSLYLFVANRQMWQGLSTTFIEWNVQEYEDNKEPEITKDYDKELTTINPIYENGDDLSYGD